MKSANLIIVFAALVLSQILSAQSSTNYVIQLGSNNTDLEDLAPLSDIANVYIESSSNTAERKISLGSFNDLSKAETITQMLKTGDYPNAYVEPLAIEKGRDVYVVQLANFDRSEQIDWSRYQLNKKVYTTIENGRYKIVTGVFPDYTSALPLHNQLYQIGFVEAEVVQLNSIFLHEVNISDIVFQQSIHDRSLGDVSEFTSKGVGPVPAKKIQEEIDNETPPLVSRVALSKSLAPAINENLARVSVKNLQSVLSVYGNYTDEPNGVYDAKTANAYYATVQLTPSLKEFSAAVESTAHITSGYFTDWSDVELLLSISGKITGTNKDHFGDAELKALISLYNNPKILSKVDAQKVSDWMVKASDQLQGWKAEGKLSSENLQAYMLVSSKVQVLLEDYFLNKGFHIDEASDLAKATMYVMLVGNFTIS